jgi:hypothetical protein
MTLCKMCDFCVIGNACHSFNIGPYTRNTLILYISSFSSNTVQSFEYYLTIAHAGWQQGWTNIYRCKLKTVWWWDYGILQLITPCLKASREVLSTNGCGRLLHILALSRKIEVLAYGRRNCAMWPLVTDDVLCSSSGDIARMPFTILYIITALYLVQI